jgi:hypothetical protein
VAVTCNIGVLLEVGTWVRNLLLLLALQLIFFTIIEVTFDTGWAYESVVTFSSYQHIWCTASKTFCIYTL